ncbi:hypothetical protein JTB14_015336 [Gonioctena quinquepunctata]|nr:hypothetical protein JTB14_015336 [Gonioctena quinquepunctata]
MYNNDTCVSCDVIFIYSNKNAVWKITDTMGRNCDKFLLLTWKNWVLQYRNPVQTTIEILLPILFAIILVVIRSLADPTPYDDIVFPSYLPISNNNLEQATLDKEPPFGNYSMMYSPRNKVLDNIMNFFQIAFIDVHGVNSSQELEAYFAINSGEDTLAGIDFGDDLKNLTELRDLKNLHISIRFPGETRFPMDPSGMNNWKTHLIYPVFQASEPRMYEYFTGGAPSYQSEGFLGLQFFLLAAIILQKNYIDYTRVTSTEALLAKLSSLGIPIINMRRFSHSEFAEDSLLATMQTMIGIIILLSFGYTCINIVRTITIERKKRLKEVMKIMGLPNWMHWLAWFLKCFLFLLIFAILMVILFKVNTFSPNYTVFTYGDPLIILVFLILYIIATITFCFALSVFFSKANTAAVTAALAWILSYSPYFFIQNNYETLSLASTLLASLLSNTAMAFGFQIMMLYEGTEEGVQWGNIFRPNSPGDNLTLGLMMVMLIIDSLIYLLIALYFEVVLPGKHGVPVPWYFPFTASYWYGPRLHKGGEDAFVYVTNEGEFFEPEPIQRIAGIQIKNLHKTFGNKVAVRSFALNMYEGQVTVLLGHDGSGKTTMMSMLTGMVTPSNGTAIINGYDIQTDIDGVRSSLGFCPGHNILFDTLTVYEHLYFFSKLKGLSKSEIKVEVDKTLELLELQQKKNNKSKTLSESMKRKLCVGMAFCGNSRVILLDEPTAGMDPPGRRVLRNLLQKKKNGRTILLTTQYVEEANLLGDRIAIMAGSELQCCGSSIFLKKMYGVGYKLKIMISKETDVGQVTQLLRSVIPSIEMQTDDESEVIYFVEDNKTKVFGPMLRKLEAESKRLGITKYTIAITTIEEVFMKVGADEGQGEIHNRAEIGIVEKYPDKKDNFLMSPNPTNFCELIFNQILAMLMKKFIWFIRSWILFLIHLLIPALLLIIAIVVTRFLNMVRNLPALPMDLEKFEDPVTLVQSTRVSGYASSYRRVLEHYRYNAEDEADISQRFLKMTKSSPDTVKRRHIVAASFEDISSPSGSTSPSITAWFNADTYHADGISLALVLNSVYRKVVDSNGNLAFTNHPLPYSPETHLRRILTQETAGFQLALNIAFSMAFVSSFFILFVIRENVSKFKHLQFVSGVGVCIFWTVGLLFDMLTYLLTIALMLIILVAFQENGFSTGAQVGRLVIIFLCFGWAFLPMIYLCGYLFKTPYTGYVKMTLFSIFTGN